MSKLFIAFIAFALFIGTTIFYFSDQPIKIPEKIIPRQIIPITDNSIKKLDDSGATNLVKDFLISSSNNFGFNFYRKINSVKNSENTFFSPYSISSALSMVYEGANGETAEQIGEVFGFTADSSARRAANAAIYNDLNSTSEKFTLQVANSLWAEKSYVFLDEYISVLKNYYAAEANNLDFFNNPDESRKTINSWVEEKTKNKIKDLFPSRSIENDTKLVLANAIYFKGKWADQFDKENTEKSDFYIDVSNAIQVDMMNRSGEDSKYNYFENTDLQAIEMPYEGDKLAMTILLPKKNDLATISSYLSAEEITKIHSEMTEEKINLSIPKFTLKTKYFMNQNLMEMGMPIAFSNDADFSGMTGDFSLKIGLVIHQAFVEVNEEGTEAAAATGVSMVLKSAMPTPPIQFIADHPFIFMIRDTKTGNILFLGEVLRPINNE